MIMTNTTATVVIIIIIIFIIKNNNNIPGVIVRSEVLMAMVKNKLSSGNNAV